MTPAQRERAEAAFRHLQKAAREMVLAAHEALEIVDETVSSAALGTILDRLGDIGTTVFKRPRTPARPAPPGPAPADPPAGTGRVERIAIR